VKGVSFMEGMERSLFHFSNPKLVEMHFSFNEDYKWNDAPQGKIELETPIGVSFSTPDEDSIVAREVYIYLTVNVGERGSSFPYYASITMGADFTWDDGLSEDMVRAMLSRNAPSLLLGYARPYIAQITAASPVGAVHIPFMKF